MGLIANFFVSRKKKFLRKIDVAVDQVKHGTYNFLFVRYLERFDRDFAGALAAAVTNTLFTEKPVGKAGEAFVAENRETIQTELLKLKGDYFIGNLVADAIQTKALLIYGRQQSGSMDHHFGKAYEILRKLDFIKKKEDVANPRLFIVKADKYFRKSLSTVKYK